MAIATSAMALVIVVLVVYILIGKRQRKPSHIRDSVINNNSLFSTTVALPPVQGTPDQSLDAAHNGSVHAVNTAARGGYVDKECAKPASTQPRGHHHNTVNQSELSASEGFGFTSEMAEIGLDAHGYVQVPALRTDPVLYDVVDPEI
jgi:hypothetical protein